MTKKQFCDDASPIDSPLQNSHNLDFDCKNDQLKNTDAVEMVFNDGRRSSITIDKPLQSIVELNYEASSDDGTFDKDTLL